MKRFIISLGSLLLVAIAGGSVASALPAADTSKNTTTNPATTVQSQAQSTPPAAPSTSSSPLNVEISPARLLLEGAPGQTISAKLRVTNRNSTPAKLKLEILKVVQTNGKLEFVQPTKADEFPGWVKPGIALPVSATPNQALEIPLTIALPNDAAFSYDYAIVLSDANAPSSKNVTQAIDAKVAYFVLLDVFSPGAKREAQISSLTSDQSWYSFLPVNLKTEVKNTGNLHVRPRGNIYIKNMFGQQVAVIDVNADQGSILTNSSRTFESSWNQGFPHYETKDGQKQLVWNWSDIGNTRFGKYTAEETLVYNDGQRDIPINAQVEFWVIPWPIVIAVLILLILLIGGIVSIVKGFWHVVHHPAKKTTEDEAEAPTKVVEEEASDETEEVSEPETEVEPETKPETKKSVSVKDEEELTNDTTDEEPKAETDDAKDETPDSSDDSDGDSRDRK